MQTATIEQVRSELSELISRVQHGETVVITEDGVPVARLVPANGSVPESDEERLERLERNGVIIRGGGGPADSRILEPFPPQVPISGVLDLLLEERREGR